MKKGLFVAAVFTVLLLSILNASFACADDGVPGAPGLEGEAQKIEQTTEKLTQWQEIGKQWKEMLLKNKYIGAVDRFLTKISIVFKIVFAEDYSLAPLFFIVVALWVYFFFFIKEIMTDFSMFSKRTSILVALGLSTGIAHMKIYSLIAKALIWLGFGDRPWWARLLIWGGVIVIAVILFMINKTIGKTIKASKKRAEEEAALEKLKAGGQAGEKLAGAMQNVSQQQSP